MAHTGVVSDHLSGVHSRIPGMGKTRPALRPPKRTCAEWILRMARPMAEDRVVLRFGTGSAVSTIRLPLGITTREVHG